MDEEVKTGEPVESKTVETEERKPSEYEVKLRKENEKLRKDLQAKLDAEAKEKEDALAKQGEYQKLYEEAKPKLNELDSLKAKLEAIETKRKNDLLSKLPEGKRDEFIDWTADQLEKVVGIVNNEQPTPVDKGKTFGANKTGKTPKTFAEWKEMNAQILR